MNHPKNRAAASAKKIAPPPCSDPWSVGKACGLRADYLCQKCEGRTDRDERGFWKITAGVLVDGVGLTPEDSDAVIKKAAASPVIPEGDEFRCAKVVLLTPSQNVGVELLRTHVWPREVLYALTCIPDRLHINQEVVVWRKGSYRAEVYHA